MPTLARTIYLDSAFGVPHDLEHAGSTLENPFVFDSVARDLKGMASEGLVEVVSERQVHHASESLIDRFTFRRMR
jgi:hypothetical protein